jgi:hypothetical protein
MAESLIYRARLLLLSALFLLTPAQAAAADNFSTQALRGVDRILIAVDGISPNFARYGLTATEMEARIATRLGATGIAVVAKTDAEADPAASQLRVALTAHENLYGLFSYRVAVEIQRKVPLDREGSSYVAQTVWSAGHSGLLNPSDLNRIYGSVDQLLDQLINAHGAQNAGVQ